MHDTFINTSKTLNKAAGLQRLVAEQLIKQLEATWAQLKIVNSSSHKEDIGKDSQKILNHP